MPPIVAGMARLLEQIGNLGLAFQVEDLIPAANDVLAYAQELCPVDTGYLRSTGFVKVENDDVLVGFDAEYASYVEFGTYKWPEGHPFLRPALDAFSGNESELVQDANDRIRDVTQ